MWIFCEGGYQKSPDVFNHLYPHHPSAVTLSYLQNRIEVPCPPFIQPHMNDPLTTLNQAYAWSKDKLHFILKVCLVDLLSAKMLWGDTCCSLMVHRMTEGQVINHALILHGIYQKPSFVLHPKTDGRPVEFMEHISGMNGSLRWAGILPSEKHPSVCSSHK